LLCNIFFPSPIYLSAKSLSSASNRESNQQQQQQQTDAMSYATGNLRTWIKAVVFDHDRHDGLQSATRNLCTWIKAVVFDHDRHDGLQGGSQAGSSRNPR
jgi:hypothetical protein